MSDETPFVQLSQVALTLPAPSGPVNVLRDVSAELGRGRTMSVAGPSGSGKTTMLMLIAGLEKATSGTVRVAGRDLSGLSEDELAVFRRENVGIVFQGFHLAPAMTALENAALPLEFAGVEDAMDRAAESLAAVGLSHRSGHYPSQLSGGEQQRVAIARAFAPRPGLLLADEPTGNLDAATGQRIIDLLFSLNEQAGSALIIVTHDPKLAERTGRKAMMVDGVLECD